MNKILLILTLFIVFLNQTMILPSIKAAENFKCDKKVDTIFVGDYHTKYAIAETQPNIKNLGVRSEKFIFTKQKIEKIIESNPQIKRVYISVNYHSFLKTNLKDLYLEHNYKYFLKNYLFLFKSPLKLLSRDGFSHIFIYYYAKYFVGMPVDFLSTLRMYINRKKHHTKVALGGYQETTSSDVSEGSLERVLIRHFHKDGRVPWNENFLDFFNIITFLKSRNIEVVVFSTPLHPVYRKAVPEVAKNIFKNKMNHVADAGITYLDLKKMSLEDQHFFDFDHLNSNGAKQFTRFVLKQAGEGR